MFFNFFCSTCSLQPLIKNHTLWYRAMFVLQFTYPTLQSKATQKCPVPRSFCFFWDLNQQPPDVRHSILNPWETQGWHRCSLGWKPTVWAWMCPCGFSEIAIGSWEQCHAACGHQHAAVWRAYRGLIVQHLPGADGPSFPLTICRAQSAAGVAGEAQRRCLMSGKGGVTKVARGVRWHLIQLSPKGGDRKSCLFTESRLLLQTSHTGNIFFF